VIEQKDLARQRPRLVAATTALPVGIGQVWDGPRGCRRHLADGRLRAADGVSRRA